MEKEENVYEQNQGAEVGNHMDAEDGKKDTGASQKASAVPEKFKDVDALARAYGSLQAEFTRRSQRLKELEKIAENFKSDEADCEESGVEKLRKVASARRLAAKEFDAFVAELCAAQKSDESERDLEPATVEALENVSAEKTETETLTTRKEMLDTDDKNAPEKKGVAGSVEPFYEKAVGETCMETFVAKQENGKNVSEDLYARVSGDESVRLRIIGEYLASIGKSGAPLTASGVGVMATPPMRAKNIGEAGIMALQYFKKPVVCD